MVASSGGLMYDVYLNGRNDLLVVPRGYAIPSDLNGNGRKKKRAVRSVSEMICQDVQRLGYHRRSLVDDDVRLALIATSIGSVGHTFQDAAIFGRIPLRRRQLTPDIAQAILSEKIT
jgi:hypothetical protein